MCSDSKTERLCAFTTTRGSGRLISRLSLCTLFSKPQQNPVGSSWVQHGMQGPCSELSGPKSAKGIHVTTSTYRWETDAMVCSTTSSISSKAEGSHGEMKKHEGKKRRREREKKRKKGERDRDISSKPCWQSRYKTEIQH